MTAQPEPRTVETRPAEPLLRWVLGDILRRRRKHQERTLADVAAQARVSMPYLSEVERGRKEASSEVLAAICRALGLTMAELVSEAYVELTAVRVHALTATTSLSSAPTTSFGNSTPLLMAA